MPDDEKTHAERVPEAIEVILGRLAELRILFGERGAAAMTAVEADLRGAIAARDRGDPAGALRLIGGGMSRLVALTERLDRGGTGTMRAAIDGFQQALVRGRDGEARRAADRMRELSGATEVKGGK